MNRRNAIIIGAGPAGLTAALELLERTDIHPIVLQRDESLGGLSRTIEYKGNRMDIGGHRFFSKSDRVMDWWLKILPLEPKYHSATISYQNQSHQVEPAAVCTPRTPDHVMLVRPRKSRIYFMRKFFEYPVRLSRTTLQQLGFIRSTRIILSYVRAALFPIRNETSLEDFLINRFGRELYRTFFRDYTEKVWGTKCNAISAEWGRQRIKGLSIAQLVNHLIRSTKRKSDAGFMQKEFETSLIEQFLYPKFGPGQMWEEVARRVREKGGQIIPNQNVDRVNCEGDRVVSISALDCETGQRTSYSGEFYFSTMAIQDFLQASVPSPPPNVRQVGDGLVYRDFIAVGMLLSRLKVKSDYSKSTELLKDNWIYIQEPDVKIGRLQIFNNWSPGMVADPTRVWIGLEYFCYHTDPLWRLSDDEMIRYGAEELAKLGIIETSDVLDAMVVREPKTYPAYFGSYERFPEIRTWLDGLQNLFPIGRNGMHRYNNQDHSMLTAMVAVDNIVAGRIDKSNLWDINTDDGYHEDGKSGGSKATELSRERERS